jgi:tRNA(Ile)-lysidine synthase
VSTAEDTRPVSDREVDALFAGFLDASALILAVSGGPDSTALLVLAADWRKRAKHGPTLTAVTVDHGLRPEAKREANAVKVLAQRLGVTHRTLRWAGPKPVTALQERARAARYRLLAEAARKSGARHVLTAHTLDDQGETVLLRMAHGSGLSGLAAMARVTPLDRRWLADVQAKRKPAHGQTMRSTRDNGAGPDVDGSEAVLVRPFLALPKSRLIATVRAAGLPVIDDPSNTDPRFARARLRVLMPALASEGLGPGQLARLARRIRRADAAIEAMVDAAARFSQESWSGRGPIVIRAASFALLPAEVALRLLGRALALVGDEGPVELGKLETFMAALTTVLASEAPAGRFRRTLAGALVTLAGQQIIIETAPARRNRTPPAKSGARRFSNGRKDLFTKQR